MRELRPSLWLITHKDGFDLAVEMCGIIEAPDLLLNGIRTPRVSFEPGRFLLYACLAWFSIVHSILRNPALLAVSVAHCDHVRLDVVAFPA